MAQNGNRLRKQIQSALIEHGVEEGVVEKLTDSIMQIIKPERSLTAEQEMVTALCKVMGQDVKISYTRYINFGKRLLNAGYDAGLITREFGPGGGYWRNDWRGQKGEFPNEAAIRENIARAADGWKTQPDRRPHTHAGHTNDNRTPTITSQTADFASSLME